jgi:hypothetical protein
MLRLLLVCSLFIATVCGCAAIANRPQSPATTLSARKLLLTPAPPNERHYILIFGSQSTPPRPRQAHSWATVVKVTCAGTGPQIEEQTISWYPRTLDIDPLKLRVEPGANLDLHFTIEEVLRQNERVSLWGPYETWHGAYQRFLTQKAFLECGTVGYQCVDTIGEAARLGNGLNCIHALTDMDPQFNRQRYPLIFFGDAASHNVVRQLHARPVLIRPQVTHDWLIPALGLERYPIYRRTYTGKTMEFSPEAILNATENEG